MNILKKLNRDGFEDNPENIVLAASTIEAAGAHSERVVYEMANLADACVSEVPPDGEMCVRALADEALAPLALQIHNSVDDYRRYLENMGVPGDLDEMAHDVWIGAIRKAASAIADDKGTEAARGYLRDRLADGEVEVSVDEELKRFERERGGR